MPQFRRKLYSRGSSFETTIPMPLLFSVDTAKKQDVIFNFDPTDGGRWYITFEEREKKSKKGDRR